MPVEKLKYCEEEQYLIQKYWNELLQSITSDEGLKVRKTEIDSLLNTETVEFYQHLHFYKELLQEKLRRVKKTTNGKDSARNSPRLNTA